ncbi:MAG TPA: tripartite tricarboxylate transporter TctB family protein [Pseudolabrys sp.]|nr:tripartite tricarboxylate transporter TctB family protein [Pseudolabrys sp.]
MRLFKQRRDYYGGGLMILMGLVAALEGRTYQIGTLRQMGPGFFPVALGILLIFLGLLIIGTALGPSEGKSESILPASLEWRGWGCIIAGPALFIILGIYGGMIPATFACVFVSALGDRSTTVKKAFLLAVGITVFGVALFSYLLKIPMPIWKWGMS